MVIAVLFFVPLFAGLLVYGVPNKWRNGKAKLLLVFAGSYLFSITLIHVLPQLYQNHEVVKEISVFVLLGFFMQHLLEYFTSGVEHGHVHTPDSCPPLRSSFRNELSVFMLLVGLCLHAFMEGSILARSFSKSLHYDANVILLGVVLHRAPVAVVMMTLFSGRMTSKMRVIFYLILFCLAAPMGLVTGEYIAKTELLSELWLGFVCALVSGSFLYISTTIMFESDPEHSLRPGKLFITLLGSSTAIAIDYVL